MADDFDFFRNDDDDLPDWLDSASSEEAPAADDFDRLRERSARASEVYEGIDDDFGEEGGGNALSGFVGALSPAQRFILVLLVFLNIIAGAVFFLVYMGFV